MAVERLGIEEDKMCELSELLWRMQATSHVMFRGVVTCEEEYRMHYEALVFANHAMKGGRSLFVGFGVSCADIHDIGAAWNIELTKMAAPEMCDEYDARAAEKQIEWLLDMLHGPVRVDSYHYREDVTLYYRYYGGGRSGGISKFDLPGYGLLNQTLREISHWYQQQEDTLDREIAASVFYRLRAYLRATNREHEDHLCQMLGIVMGNPSIS